MKKITLLRLNEKEFRVKNKYIIEFDFNEFKMLQESIEKMHYNEFYAHWLSEFLKSKLQTILKNANISENSLSKVPTPFSKNW